MKDSYEFIRVTREDHLITVTINRPEVMNALHPPACKELDEVFNEFSDDRDLWVAIITGAGDKAFCVGNDLRWQAEHGAEALRREIDQLKGGFGGITRRSDCFKPIIAAVNGFALGGGFEIALSCDVIIASDSARFGLPEPKVGAVAAAGGAIRLPRQIPYHLAMGMLLTGRHITADEAFRLGIVNEVVPLNDLMACARKWADEMLACSPIALRVTKEIAVKSLDMPLSHALYTVFPGLQVLRNSEDYMEGARAFAEKRKPRWKGR
ncbi:MAG: enoyl-CoA hydratase-related protein [Thermodesulforhabdaceae bacterium]